MKSQPTQTVRPSDAPYAQGRSWSWTPGRGRSGPAREWVLALGEGSFAMGTVAGTPTRRYHATLVASAAPPVRREHLVGAIDERVELDGLVWTLTPLHFARHPEAPVSTQGVRLARFTLDPGAAAWEWELFDGDARVATITKRLEGDDGAPSVRVSYSIAHARGARLTLTPLVSLRDFHEIHAPGSLDAQTVGVEPESAGLTLSHGARRVSVRPQGFEIEHTPGEVWRELAYARDHARGQSYCEDLFAPIRLITDASASVVFARRGAGVVDFDGALASRRARIGSMTSAALAGAGDPRDERVRDAVVSLASCADAFVVRRDGFSSVIAGYPWFSDWGRDTMIALEGLMLVTRRGGEALACLRAFASAREHGLIPNRFDDDAARAHFNTIDASLWFVHACARWSAWAREPIPPDLLDAVRDVIDAHERGTVHGIAMDPRDALIAGGDETTQLTWMDALRDGVAFTPRHGKAVEINALWIRALRVLREHGETSSERDHAASLAARALASLTRVFGDGPRGALRDVEGDDDSVRPNQVFAASLPITLGTRAACSIVEAIRETLLTPVGLRTLARADPGYEPGYKGSLIERDRAYHNGTVWPWLLGPWCEALMRAHNFDDSTRREAVERLAALARRADTDSCGSIHEVYDAEPDERGAWRPDGCPAQAWSVAETLRVLVLASDPGSTPEG